MKKFYIYKITNIVNGKVYIGKTNNVEKRWSKHVRHSCDPKCKHHFILHQAIAKYGVINFSHEIIETVNDERLSLDREVYWISFYKSNVSRYGSQHGYNLTDGGDGASGYRHSEESKQKMRKPKRKDRKRRCKKYQNVPLLEKDMVEEKVNCDQTQNLRIVKLLKY